MNVSRETKTLFSGKFKDYASKHPSGSVCLDELSVLPLLLPSFGRAYLVVDDDVFESLFYLLYRSNNISFSIITNLNTKSPPGFGSPLERYKQNVSIYKGVENQFVLINKSTFDEGMFFVSLKPTTFTINNSCEYEDLLSALGEASYVRVSTVSVPGTFAVRGSVIDFFPKEHHSPVRVDFSYDNVDIFVFSIESQTTSDKLGSFVFALSVGEERFVGVEDFLCGLTPLFFSNGCFSWGGGSVKKINLNTCYYDSCEDYSSGFVAVRDLRSWGLVFGEERFIPSWFLSGDNEGGRLSKGAVSPVSSGGLDSLSINDYVVHEDYGVGVFLGFVDTDEGNDSFLSIGFEDAKINVHLSKIGMIGYYADSSTPGVVLNSVSKQGLWKRKKSSVSKKIDSFVASVYSQHIKRSSLAKKRALLDEGLLSSFVDAFSFKDTPDQALAFSSIKEDLSSPIPMDRLVCGDVGFGKTELAMRAAFVMALQGEKTVVLCPTTVLCYQIFNSFSSRLSPFSVNVEMVSRLSSKGGVDKSIASFNSGEVDVLVATHRIFGYVNQIQSVGLLIVDEEHRFGVRQKECFPDNFPLIDQLYLSATPIPRSLQSALSGIKTMSIMSTPPINRLPIQTSVEYFNLDRIVDYIKYERGRGGQVYFLYNNIDSLTSFKRKLVSQFNNLRVCIIHAKMSASKVRDVLLDFVSKKYDVLLSTSIIENGLDIPNVNTIIINNAHLFGLSQLHQIRGRVGRNYRQAFAHLLIPKNFELKRNSKRRLKAIEENVALGSGYALSSKDLEIRGAGTVFGYAQSGGADVGFELYNKLVAESVSRGESFLFESIVVDVFGSAAHIPSSQIKDPELRVSIYKQLSAIDNEKDLSLFFDNIENRFGKLSRPFRLLFKSHSLKILCFKSFVSSVYFSKERCVVVFLPMFFNSKFPDFLVWVDSFFKAMGVDFNFKESAGKKLSVSFFIDSKNKDILVFIKNFLNKFEYEFLSK